MTMPHLFIRDKIGNFSHFSTVQRIEEGNTRTICFRYYGYNGKDMLVFWKFVKTRKQETQEFVAMKIIDSTELFGDL